MKNLLDILQFEFEVPGKVQAKQRPRLSRYGKVYTPGQTSSYENWIKLCFVNKYGNIEPISQKRFFIKIDVYKSVPKSITNKNKIKMLNNEIRPTVKPDADNVVKSVLDALNKLIYKDDSQVTDLLVHKYYSEEEKLVLNITAFEN